MQPRRWLTHILVVAAFAIAMGYLEAVVVVYIRVILGIGPTPEHLDADVLDRVPQWLIHTEMTREAATIVMLVCLAFLASPLWRIRIGTFLVAFGVWDLVYYASLWCLIDWPGSLSTVDVLFLIPRPWIAPVWLPMALATAMVVIGALIMRARKEGTE